MTTTRRSGLAVLGLVSGLVGAVPTATAAGLEVASIETAEDGATRTVRVATSGKPNYSVFKLTEPFRVLVDLPNTSAAPGLESMTVRDGVITKIRTMSFDEAAGRTTRVEIGLSEARPYEVEADANGLTITIESAGPAEPDRPQLGKLRVERGGKAVVLTTKISKEIASDAVEMEALSNPARIMIDIVGAGVSPKYQRVDVRREGIARARVAGKDDRVRIVLDLKKEGGLPEVTIDSRGDELRIQARQPAPPPPPVAAAPTPRPEPEAPSEVTADSPLELSTDPTPSVASNPATAEPSTRASAVAAPLPVAASGALNADDAPVPLALTGADASEETAVEAETIKDIRVEPKDGFLRLTVVLDSAGFEVARAGEGNAPRLFIPGVKLPKQYERTLDVSEVSEGALAAVSSFNADGGIVLAAGIHDDTEHRHWSKDNRLMWDFRRAARKTSVSRIGTESTAGYKSTGLTLGQITPSAKYRGRRISLDLKDADIQNVLRLLADVSKLNIVAGDDVQGKVTIKLRNVPWDQALDIILTSKQLDKTRNGNIIRVAPIEVLRKEEELRLERMRAQEELEPLKVRLIPISYAAAEEIKPQVTALLSTRGKVNIDLRTNVLIVEDIEAHLIKVERLVRTLDTQTPQVLIESRIVEARSNFSRELGVQWGGTVNFSQQYGNQTGLGFPSNIAISGGADDQQNNQTAGVAPTPNYAVNLPATVGSGGGGALGFVLGSVDGSALINLRLSAAEAVGKIKLVSAPKIVTMDNKEARILSGEKVPITVITANGPTTRFISANLELGVTPHVTQDGAILMKIEAKKNELSDRVDFLGVPGILTNEATTEMIVQDGDTAVLGGLYRRNAQDNEAYVPWIGKVPVIGWLFKTTSKEDTRNELLIFISPRIVNRQSALVRTE